MSSFFQQLVAREQGQVPAVTPLIAPRFSQAGSAALESQALTEPVQSYRQSAPNPASSSQANALVEPDSPVAQPRRDRIEQPSNWPRASRQGVSLEATDMSARLSQVSQWIGELAAAKADRSQQTALDADVLTTVRHSNHQLEQPQVDIPSHLESQNLEAPLSTANADTSQAQYRDQQPSTPVSDRKSEHAPSRAQPASQRTAPTPRAAELAIQPLSHRLQPTSPSGLQPCLQSPPLPAAPPAPTIQVAIGRVEIRATTPAKPTPRPARSPPKRPALSLEQYLQRRSQGG